MTRVFLVDREAAVRRHLADLLGLEGDIQVIGHTNGRDSADWVAAMAPDVILLGMVDSVLVERLVKAWPFARRVALVDQASLGLVPPGIDAVVDRLGPWSGVLEMVRQGSRTQAGKFRHSGTAALASPDGSAA